MKEKIAAIILMFLLMALLPFIAAKCSQSSADSKTTMSTADTPSKTDEQNDYEKILCALTAAKYKDNYCNETIKALAVIQNTNYRIDPDSFSDEDFLYKENASGNILETYTEIEKAVKSVKEKTLCINNKAFFIPFSDSSNGLTGLSDEYEYIQSVASPWDCFLKDYDENTNCVGVSLSGINYLCNNGANYTEALKWYLPNFDISE